MPDRTHFHLLAKPSGATCNIDCTYCFFLSKEALYPDGSHRMSHETLEAYLRQLLEAHAGPVVPVAWQGGEPTLMKLEFFERAVQLAERLLRPGQTLEHSLQTNGLLLDDDWCEFLARKGFLVGLSIDGPADLHDTYRVDRKGQGTHALVLRGLECLKRHGVDFNILCTVNAANQAHGRRVYRYFRDTLGARFVQFIPIVERATAATVALANIGWRGQPRDKRPLYRQVGSEVTVRSVGSAAYGQFLVDVFEEWVRHDIGTVYVQLFDVTLEALFGRHLLCIHAPTCGTALALEFNGDLFSCDHFVEPDYRLGNIHQRPMIELLALPAQKAFGQAKLDGLTAQCRACEVRALCHGGCPKDRFAVSAAGEAGHNVLCEGLFRFFTHTRPAMQRMAALVQARRPPASLMQEVAAADQRLGPYGPCPCGSGRKLKFCHRAKG